VTGEVAANSSSTQPASQLALPAAYAPRTMRLSPTATTTAAKARSRRRLAFTRTIVMSATVASTTSASGRLTRPVRPAGTMTQYQLVPKSEIAIRPVSTSVRTR
jgi:hypothetical protein